MRTARPAGRLYPQRDTKWRGMRSGLGKTVEMSRWGCTSGGDRLRGDHPDSELGPISFSPARGLVSRCSAGGCRLPGSRLRCGLPAGYEAGWGSEALQGRCLGRPSLQARSGGRTDERKSRPAGDLAVQPQLLQRLRGRNPPRQAGQLVRILKGLDATAGCGRHRAEALFQEAQYDPLNPFFTAFLSAFRLPPSQPAPGGRSNGP